MSLTRASARSHDDFGVAVPVLEVSVLGGFRVERDDGGGPVSQWQRRSAKTLTKLLATCPEHALHREQIIELMWPGVEIDSALNSLAKAVHAVRHALEPQRPPRGGSAYLRTRDAMVSLAMDHVSIDADRFQRLAEDALRAPDVDACERALDAYGGELLPEDRYADWCAERRGFLAELRVRLLLELAELYEARGSYNLSADRLREVLFADPTREAVHRRLMKLYVHMGMPDQALRQFRLCEDTLRREFDLIPQDETLTFVRQILSNSLSMNRCAFCGAVPGDPTMTPWASPQTRR